MGGDMTRESDVVAPDDPDLAAGLDAWADGRWFAAHEHFEVRWRRTPHGPDRHALQALVQCAVALEHARRGHPRAALGQWTKALGHLSRVPDRASWAGLDLVALERDLAAFWAGVDLEGAVRSHEAGVPWRLPDAPVPPRPRGSR
ncbi:MAG: hypothetical protein RLZZ299_1627 [Pseudomonadota bacterium]|jgi:hypothetical protein